MTEDPKTTRGEGLDTMVDEPREDEGLETAISTLFVGDDERTVAPRSDSGGTTTVIVPDDEPARPPVRGWLEYRGAIAAVLAALVLVVILFAAALLFLVRALSSEGRGAEPAAPTPSAPGPLPLPPDREPRAAGEGAGASAEPAPRRTEPVRATARCSYQPAYGGYGSLTIACDLTNTAPTAVRATVVPVVYRGAVPERVHHEELTLAPGERILRRYELRGRSERDIGSGCACEATTAP